MSSILKFLLGVTTTSWAEDGEWEWQWSAAPTGDRALLLLLVGISVLVTIVALYRWDARRLTVARRSLLCALRCGIVFVAIAMLLEPVILLRSVEWIPSHLLTMVDNSQSMGLRDAWQDTAKASAICRHVGLTGGPDALRGMTRLELVDRSINSNLVAELEAGGDRVVHWHTFSDRLHSSEGKTFALSAGGQTTAIGGSLRQLLRAYRGMPLAGVLLISDGQSNSGEPIADVAELVAKQGVPVVTLAVGSIEGPRNVELHRLDVNPVVFVRDSNRVTAFVKSSGLSGTAVTVTLEKRRNEGSWQELGQEELVLDLEGLLQSVSFDCREARTGRLEYRASLSDIGPELTKDDNVAISHVKVIRQKLHVLFIAGSTFPEVQFLRNSLLLDNGIELTSWLMAADDTYEHPGDNPIRRLPSTQAELDEFDCLVLYDPDPHEWPPNFSDLMVHFVAKSGGGLIYIAGEMQTRQLFDRQNDSGYEWLSLLPVVREPGLFRSQVQMRLSARSAWRLSLTDAGRRDTVFAFSTDREKNEGILKSLPGMYWHFPVTRAKPGATILAHHGDPRMRNEFGPETLLATHLVGPGKCYFVGFDSTYRWRYLDEQFFDGFWARMIGRAGRNKQLGGNYPFRLSTDRVSYAPGSQVTITARFDSPDDVEPGLLTLPGEIEVGVEAAVPISLQATGEGDVFQTTFLPRRAGPHLIKVWTGAPDAGNSVRSASLAITVDPPNLEYESPQLDEATLQDIANITGGKAFGLTEIDQLPAAFKIREVSSVLEDRQEVWDAPLFFGALFLMLVTEWLLRKRYRLI